MIILIVIEVVRIQRNCGAASVDWGGGRGGGGGGGGYKKIIWL